VSATTLSTMIHGVVAVVLIAAITTLLALHDLTEATAISLYGVALATIGAATGIQLAKEIPSKNQNTSA